LGREVPSSLTGRVLLLAALFVYVSFGCVVHAASGQSGAPPPHVTVRARSVGVYRFWRDFGFVAGALIAGVGADATSPRTAIVIVAALTAASGLAVVATRWHPRPTPQPVPVK
jgi:hypothetical protein